MIDNRWYRLLGWIAVVGSVASMAATLWRLLDSYKDTDRG